jgi:uncharacterized membrane protein
MLPRALVGEIKPENWFGLIDAIYAIILTLLLLELPGFLLEALKEAEFRSADHSILLNSILYSFFGYLAIFIIVYDIWAHHRVLLAYSSASRFNLAVGTFMLFLTSLLPPALTLLSKMKGELALGSFSAIGPVYELLKDERLLIAFILVGVYGCITLLSIKELHAIRGREELSHNAKVMERVRYSGFYPSTDLSLNFNDGYQLVEGEAYPVGLSVDPVRRFMCFLTNPKSQLQP